MRDDDEAAEIEGDWKFAAMVLDRSVTEPFMEKIFDIRPDGLHFNLFTKFPTKTDKFEGRLSY